MAIQGKHETWAMIAGEDMDDLTAGTGHIFKAVALDDQKIAANGLEAGGVLTQVGKNNEHVTLAVRGIMKFTAGGAVTAGARVTVTTSGYFTAAGSGDYVVGRALEAAVASGAVGHGLFDFANPYYMTTSN